MTANAMQGDRDACLAAGMNDYLSKPIKSQDLLERLLGIGAQPTAQQTSTEQAHFDYAEALAEADQETVEIIAELFLNNWPQDIARLRQAAQTADAAAFERGAHSLKGTLGTFAAIPAIRMSGELESLAKQVPLPELLPRVDALERELALLSPCLRSVVDRISE
jgi:CheY-like chemotaxis protein